MFEKKRIALGLFFLAIGFFFLYQISQFKFSYPPEEGTLHPMAFPRTLMWLWCALSVLYIFVPRPGADLAGLKKVLPRITGIFISIIIFIILIRYLGFIISGFLLLLSIFWFLDYRRPMRAVPLAMVLVLLMWVAFNYGMHMPLPDFSL